MAPPFGIAIVGCGYWGVNYVRVFEELPSSHVVVVCDKREDRLQQIARRFPGVAVTMNVDDGLRMKGVDAAAVCTEATTHYDLARRCLDLDKPVLVEKPMTTLAARAEELVETAANKNLVLMVGHTFLYNPGIGKIRQYIIDGRLGRIYYLYARRTNLGPIREDVNALWDLAPHDVSIFNYFLDSTPEWVSAVGAKVLHNSREDVGFISLGYRGGIIGHIHVSWADPHKVREVVVVGSDERVVFNDLDSVERVRVFEKGVTPVESDASSYGDHHLRMRDGDIISPRIDVSEPLRNECAHFLECVSEGKQPLSDGRSGLDVVRTMEAISRSVAQKGAPLELAGVRHHEYQPLHDTSAVR